MLQALIRENNQLKMLVFAQAVHVKDLQDVMDRILNIMEEARATIGTQQEMLRVAAARIEALTSTDMPKC